MPGPKKPVDTSDMSNGYSAFRNAFFKAIERYKEKFDPQFSETVLLKLAKKDYNRNLITFLKNGGDSKMSTYGDFVVAMPDECQNIYYEELRIECAKHKNKVFSVDGLLKTKDAGRWQPPRSKTSSDNLTKDVGGGTVDSMLAFLNKSDNLDDVMLSFVEVLSYISKTKTQKQLTLATFTYLVNKKAKNSESRRKICDAIARIDESHHLARVTRETTFSLQGQRFKLSIAIFTMGEKREIEIYLSEPEDNLLPIGVGLSVTDGAIKVFDDRLFKLDYDITTIQNIFIGNLFTIRVSFKEIFHEESLQA